jgi:RHS repeat-associated protein
MNASWQYKPNSGLEDASRVSLGLTDLHWVTGVTYRGVKLSGYRDEVGKTTYSYWYTDSGQLRGSSAVPFDMSPLSQSSFMCSSYTLTKSFGAGPSYGNLERVREMRTPAFTDTYNFAGLGIATNWPPGPDAPTTVTTNTTTKPYVYDHAGRLTSKALGAESFEYNVLGQLVRVLRGGVQAEALAHDPVGLLLGRVSGNQVTYYLGDRATVTATALAGCTGPGCGVDPATLKVDVHLTARATRAASVRVQGGSLGRVLYYHRDRLRSVVATSIGGGIAGASYRFGPWGDTRVAQGDSGDGTSERGFADAIRLSGSLLVMGVRVYDSQLRQFLQPDPLDPLMYTYAGGDPVNLVDRTGMEDTPSENEGKTVPTGADTPRPDGGTEEITVWGPRNWRAFSRFMDAGLAGGSSSSDSSSTRPESRWWKKTKWNFKVTTKTIASPVVYVWRVVRGQGGDYWTVVMGVGFYEAIGGFTGEALTITGIPTALGYFTDEVVNNAGLPVSVPAALLGSAAVYAIRTAVIAGGIAGGVLIGSGIEAAAEIALEDL